jgi:phage-related protein
MVAATKSLWNLVWGKPQVDPTDLASAISAELDNEPFDFRTRLLIRDSLRALEQYWGTGQFDRWLHQCAGRDMLEAILSEDLGDAGFPSLRERLMDKTDPEVVRQLFRELGTHLHRSTRLAVGGSIAVIMPGQLSRATEDIDVVDEVPDEIRSQHKLLNDLRKRFGLQLTHFQSHYLPSGWEKRVHGLEPFAQLQVYLVDPIDVFLSKLFSKRTKDLDDLRALAPQLEKDTIIQRLRDTTAALRADETLRQCGEKNWYIVYGEPLPS